MDRSQMIFFRVLESDIFQCHGARSPKRFSEPTFPCIFCREPVLVDHLVDRLVDHPVVITKIERFLQQKNID